MSVRHRARGTVSLRGVAAVRTGCEGLHDGRGNSLGVWSLLHFTCKLVQCKMQKLSRKQKAALPPATLAPGYVCKSQSPLSACFFQAEACWHSLLILLHSVTVQTGGGDSPLLIHASPQLLLVGHFLRGEGAAGLALPICSKAESSDLPFVRQALRNLQVVRNWGDVACVNYCCGAEFVHARSQRSGGKCSLQPHLGWRWGRCWRGCRAGFV